MLGDNARAELSNILIAFALNLVFVGLITLILWPLGQLESAFRLAKGYALLWVVLILSMLLLSAFFSALRIDIYSHFDAYVGSNLVVSSILMIGWCAFAAVVVHGMQAGASTLGGVASVVLGLLCCFAAYIAMTGFFSGTIYRLLLLPLGAIAYCIFTLWPAATWLLFGWFIAIFGMQ